MANHSTATNPHGEGSYIPALDGWRAIAIALVMSFHGLFNTDVSGRPLLAAVQKLSARTGSLGVLIFFAISGYIITSRLYAESNGGPISLRVFYTKRVFRILPPMTQYLLVLVALYLAHVITLQRRDWFAPIFLTNYFPGSWYIRHFWSLSVEEHFYMVWPLCIVLAGWRRALWVGVFIVGVVAVWRPWQLAHLVGSMNDPVYVEARGVLLSHTEMRLDYIMMGCIIALMLRFYPGTHRWLHAAGSGVGMVCLLVLLVLSTREQLVDTRTLQAVVIALMVCGSSLTKTWFSTRVLGNRYLLFLGKLSYSLYLWQELFLADSGVAWLRSPLALPLKFAVAIGVACLSYNFVEKPLIRVGRRVIQGWQVDGVVAVPAS
jgi:peptidoglycan/LPS O-acetylase OafA/YrhL